MVQYIKGEDLSLILQTRFKIKPDQLLKITVEVEEDLNNENYGLNDAVKQSLIEVESHLNGKTNLTVL